MLYSSGWTRVPEATAAVMTGLIVACARWPACAAPPVRRAGLDQGWAACPSPACRGPVRLPACGTVRAIPFGDSRRLPFVHGHDVDLIDFYLALERHRRRLGSQATVQCSVHRLRVRSAQAQLQGDLPVRQVQAHEIGAQHPHAQRPVVSGQHRATQVVEAPNACFAPTALPAGLHVVVAAPGDVAPATCGAAHVFRCSRITCPLPNLPVPAPPLWNPTRATKVCATR